MKNTITYSFLILTFGVMLIGCYTPKKASNQAHKIQGKFPEIMARYCGLWYPIVSDTNSTTWFIPGEATRDTLVVYRKVHDTVFVDRYISQTVHDTIRTSKTVTQESTAKLEELRITTDKKIRDLQTANNKLEADLIAKDKEIAKVTEDKNDWRKWAFIFGGAWIAFLVLKLILWYVRRQSGGLLR